MTSSQNISGEAVATLPTEELPQIDSSRRQAGADSDASMSDSNHDPPKKIRKLCSKSRLLLKQNSSGHGKAQQVP